MCAACARKSTTSCVGVGAYYAARADGTLVERTLVEQWNGRSWSITPTPNLGGATHANLSGVSCHTPTSCFAVGSRGNVQSDDPLIERYG